MRIELNNTEETLLAAANFRDMLDRGTYVNSFELATTPGAESELRDETARAR